MKIELHSRYRYNGGIAVKRQWGSSTVTEFFVTVDGNQMPWYVIGYGKTPGERKTQAKAKALAKLESEGK